MMCVMRTYLALGLGFLLGLSGCSREKASFQVVNTDPRDGAWISLNQEIWVGFSHLVDSTSVNERTLRILDSDGNQVPGRFRVLGRFVVFTPRPPLSPRLDDGGFKPGGTYLVEVPGFPLLDTVRTLRGGGQTLARTFRMVLHAVTGKEKDSPLPLLMDTDSPGRGALPLLRGKKDGKLFLLDVQAGINPRITFSEPLDPRFLEGPGPFLLSTLEGKSIGIQALRLPSKGVPPDQLGRVLELVPSRPLEPSREYRLRILPGPWLYDYNRNPLDPGTPDGRAAEVLVRVEPRAGEEFFQDPRGCSLETSPGQAWAWWGEGMVTACLLKEAGNGALGVLRPKGDLTFYPGARVEVEEGRWIRIQGRDLSFSRIQVPRGVTLRFAPGGAWVIRSQGPVEIDGNLVLEGEGAGPPQGGMLLSPAELLQRRVRSLQGGGAILVSSGNLYLGGNLRSHGSGLVLASGGRVLLGRRFRKEGGWVECADRSRPLRPGPWGGAEVNTRLLPDRKSQGWVTLPMEAEAVSTFREIPKGLGPLRQPVLQVFPEEKDSVLLTLQGAPEDPLHPGKPDLTRLTPEYPPTHVGALEGMRFFRFRIRMRVPPGPNAVLPRVTAFLLGRTAVESGGGGR